MLFNSIKISFNNLRAHKLRSLLTVLGIIIGVASVVIIFSVGRSAQELILDEIRGVGSDLLAVLPGASDNENGPPAVAFGITITTLTYDDLNALRNPKNIPQVIDGSGYVQSNVLVEYGNISQNKPLVGTTASYINVENAEIEQGRFFNKEEENDLSRVVVVGSDLADDFFKSKNPINQKIKINKQTFKIIGVFKKRGSVAFGVSDQDGGVFIPLKTAQRQILGMNYLNFIRLKIKSADQLAVAKSGIEKQLRKQHRINNPIDDDFSVRDLASALSIITKVTDVLRYILLTIGIIALLVGGIGIMNIMLISVNQRIREIGLRQAVGAWRKDLFFQFLIEATIISLLGGVVGIISGILISWITAIIIQHLGYNWQLNISLFSVVVALAVSLGVGLIFGVYPAKKATKISPMEALRYE